MDSELVQTIRTIKVVESIMNTMPAVSLIRRAVDEGFEPDHVAFEAIAKRSGFTYRPDAFARLVKAYVEVAESFDALNGALTSGSGQ